MCWLRWITLSMAVMLLAPTAALASPAPLTDFGLPTATDQTGLRYSPGGSVAEGCSYDPQYRVNGGEWMSSHPTRSFVHLPDVLAVHRVELRIGCADGGLPSAILAAGDIRLVEPGVLNPRVTSFEVPSTTSASTIPVDVAAVSGDHGMPAVTKMRFATEDGNWGEWRPFAASASAPVSAGTGFKAVFVQVGDGQRESAPVMRRFQRIAPTTTTPEPIAADYLGWATVSGTTPRPSWKWTPTGWATPTTIAPGTRIYAHPFPAAGWHWVWHDSSWHAIRTADLRS